MIARPHLNKFLLLFTLLRIVLELWLGRACDFFQVLPDKSITADMRAFAALKGFLQ